MQKDFTVYDLPAFIFKSGGSSRTARVIWKMMKVSMAQITLAMVFTGLVIANDNYAQRTLDREVSLSVKELKLSSVLRKIEATTKVKFVYSRSYVELDDKISIEVSEKKLREVLEDLLNPRKIQFHVQENDFIVLTRENEPLNSAPGNTDTFSSEYAAIKVGGKVSDKQGVGIPGVSVLLKGTNTGTVTDVEGMYSIDVEADAVLVFSSIGFVTQEIPIGGRVVIDVIMEEDVKALEEVVVVGYGTEKKVNLTGSVSTINVNTLTTQPVSQTSAGLLGQAAGVTVLQNSGQPGSDGGTIRIRGVGTIGNSNPLVLIDGVAGNLNEIDPNNIANISILKDASSAAIYGSRAANGVILVTTKRGEAGLNITYNNYFGIQRFSEKPEYVNGGEYMRYFNLARQNEGADPLYTEEYIAAWEANHKTDPDHYPNTDWVDVVASEPGFQQEHDLNVTGGSNIMKYYGSLRYSEQNGNIPNFSYKRYSIRLNTDIKISNKIDFQFDINGRVSDRTRPSASTFELERGIFRIPPIYADVYSDGSWGPGWPGTGNPVAYAKAGGLNETSDYYFRGIMKTNFTPIEGLKFSLMYAPEASFGWNDVFRKQYHVYDVDTKDLILTFPSVNSKTVESSRAFSHFVNAIGSYTKTFGEQSMTFLVGYEFLESRNEFIDIFRDGFPLQEFQEVSSGSIANWRNNGNTTENALQSFFGRVNYNFKEKYLLEANLRYDGSSRFNEDNRYGAFPSFSAGWRVSEESFLNTSNLVSNLKVRASWGMLGNQQIGGLYPYVSTISLNKPFILGGAPASGSAQTQYPNTLISWETSETTNIGLDVGVLQERLSLSFDYYVRNTRDILLELPIPMTLGKAAPFQNAGQVRNTGWDLALGYRNQAGEFAYDINFNLSDVKNEVADLRGTGPFIENHTIIQEGRPINSIFGYEVLGFFTSADDIANSPLQAGNIVPGDLKYRDVNGDDIINADDRVIIGNPFPRFSYGLNFSASYKRFDFTIFFQGVGRQDLYLQGDAGWAFLNAGSMQEWHKDFWTPDNLDASYPRLSTGSAGNNFQPSDFWVYGAQYLRLRNLTIGYTLPLQKVINKVRVYASGQNLFTVFDNLPPGWDPVTPNGTAGALYPVVTSYNAGLNVTF